MSFGPRSMWVVLCFSVVAALLVAASSGATPRTTYPGPAPAYAFIVITDQKIIYTHNGPGPVFVRGAYVAFNVRNKGKKPHNFSLLGKTTRPIAPGKFRNTPFYGLFRRGRFVYRSTLDKSPAFRGFIRVE